MPDSYAVGKKMILRSFSKGGFPFAEASGNVVRGGGLEEDAFSELLTVFSRVALRDTAPYGANWPLGANDDLVAGRHRHAPVTVAAESEAGR